MVYCLSVNFFRALGVEIRINTVASVFNNPCPKQQSNQHGYNNGNQFNYSGKYSHPDGVAAQLNKNETQCNNENKPEKDHDPSPF